ncbi:hypothetical protein KY285_031206 [Solanum tuberosum]|nr:hypothetical protein KY289_031336 [Solanum tuberosum]KAH0656324.1 hypothetical protein KY285_031206 [Solanum tuberosum]
MGKPSGQGALSLAHDLMHFKTLASSKDTKDLATFWFQTLNTLSWTRPYEFDADEYWNMVDSPVQCLTHHLKKVLVAGHVMKKQVIQFLEYLFEHFVVLEEMKIFAEKQCIQRDRVNFYNLEK